MMADTLLVVHFHGSEGLRPNLAPQLGATRRPEIADPIRNAAIREEIPRPVDLPGHDWDADRRTGHATKGLEDRSESDTEPYRPEDRVDEATLMVGA